MAAPAAAFIDPLSDTAHGGATKSGRGSRDLVLLVEDDDMVADLVTRILVCMSHRVERARNGAECVRVFDENASAIALVILDCRLPDSDGVSLCRELRTRSPDVPLLLTSGRNYSTDAIAAACATDFLPKPFLPADVRCKVSALVGAGG